MSESPRRYRLTAAQRLSGRAAFEAVFATRRRRYLGPLCVYGRPNGLNWSRLGMAVGRRVGSAVRRNRIKRRLREAFRLHQYELPAGYDFVIVVRPHQTLQVNEYARFLLAASKQVAGLFAPGEREAGAS